MKRLFLYFALLLTFAVWPTGLVLSGPPRSWDRIGGEIEVERWNLPRVTPPELIESGPISEAKSPEEARQQQEKLDQLKDRLDTDRRRLKGEQTKPKANTAKLVANKPTPAPASKPASGGTKKKLDKDSLRHIKVDNSSDDAVQVEYIGKGRRLKRVKKSTGGIGEQLYKPPGKLIITDDYHKTVPELLETTELRSYMARPGESSWKTSSSKFLCEIRHPIPGFGFGVFRRGIGEPMQFAIESFRHKGGSGPARVQSGPAIWAHYASLRDLGMVPVKPKGRVLFTVAQDWATRLMLELEEGMQPSFAFWDDYSGGSDVIVKLSPFNFKKTIPEFNRCMGDLLPYSFKDVRKTTVYFGYDKASVSSTIHARLKKIVEYVKLDKSVKYVDVAGFSDSLGFKRYNEMLSKKRANAVRKYLQTQGLDPKKIRVRSLGEKGKKHSNRTESGRRKNRRVEVTLIK